MFEVKSQGRRENL